MLRDTSTALPLLSGLTVEVASVGAISLKLLTASSVSLWNQMSTSDFKANISASLDTRATLLHHGNVVHELTSSMSTVGTVGGDVKVAFSAIPIEMCMRMQRDEVQESFEAVEEIPQKPRKKKTISRSRRYPGVTFRLNEDLTKQCNSLADNTLP